VSVAEEKMRKGAEEKGRKGTSNMIEAQSHLLPNSPLAAIMWSTPERQGGRGPAIDHSLAGASRDGRLVTAKPIARSRKAVSNFPAPLLLKMAN
jgi:hypothetical protein